MQDNANRLNDSLLNEGLLLSASFTSTGLFGVRSALESKHPELHREIVHAAAAKSHEACGSASSCIAEMFKRTGGTPNPRIFNEEFLKLHPWADDAALSALFNRGMYLAYKDGYQG